jgi:hypothetical protein
MDGLVSAAMSVLNMRLGLWIRNPRRKRRPLLGGIPTYLHPVLTCGLLDRGNKPSSSFVEISDGGNFDNLGIYELVRRRLGLIVVVDGEADPSISLSSLASVVVRVREDFDTTITFVDPQGPGRLVPFDIKSAAVGQYPLGAKFAEAAYMVGTITYGGPQKGSGVIIYLKATLTKDLAFTTYGYRAQFSDFPHETTVDQFFDPVQFEAYRDLGYRSCSRMIQELDLERTISARELIQDEYSKSNNQKAAATPAADLRKPVNQRLKQKRVDNKRR